jgi:hypothetical protein
MRISFPKDLSAPELSVAVIKPSSLAPALYLQGEPAPVRRRIPEKP